MSRRIRTALAAIAVTAGLAAAVPAASAATRAPMAGHLPVAYNWWLNSHETSHYYGSTRPRVWGNSYGEPFSGIRWASWTSHSALGHGLFVHMNCQPCHVTIYLHDVQIRNGFPYFERVKITSPDFSTGYSHWSFTARAGPFRGEWVS